jgi:hypothetical protein
MARCASHDSKRGKQADQSPNRPGAGALHRVLVPQPQLSKLPTPASTPQTGSASAILLCAPFNIVSRASTRNRPKPHRPLPLPGEQRLSRPLIRASHSLAADINALIAMSIIRKIAPSKVRTTSPAITVLDKLMGRFGCMVEMN